MICQYCGFENCAENSFCIYCGSSLYSTSEKRARKMRILIGALSSILVIAILLGACLFFLPNSVEPQNEYHSHGFDTPEKAALNIAACKLLIIQLSDPIVAQHFFSITESPETKRLS